MSKIRQIERPKHSSIITTFLAKFPSPVKMFFSLSPPCLQVVWLTWAASVVVWASRVTPPTAWPSTPWRPCPIHYVMRCTSGMWRWSWSNRETLQVRDTTRLYSHNPIGNHLVKMWTYKTVIWGSAKSTFILITQFEGRRVRRTKQT